MANLDMMLGLARLITLTAIVMFLWRSGIGKLSHAQVGGRCILGGLVIMIFTEFLFVSDVFSPLGNVTMSGNGAATELLGMTVGYMSGFVLLTYGLFQWVPDLQSLTTEITMRKQSEEELMRTYNNIRVLVREQTAELQMAVTGLEAEVNERAQVEQELSRHKTHLEEIVVERTEVVQRQAEQLEEALEKEKVFSARQREFVSLVSHEFRTPLTIIDGSAQRMVRRKEKLTSSEVVTRTSRIREAVQRMTGLIEATLYASRLDAGKMKVNYGVCDIKRVIRDICTQQAEISSSYNITVDTDALPDKIVADRDVLGQAITNLISNAVKYSPQSKGIEVHGWVDGDNALVSVRDHGVGISEDDLPRLFERFFRASTSAGIPGTGIGLNVVKQMIEMHDGKVWVESVENEGSTFTFAIPSREKDIGGFNEMNASGMGAGI